MISVKLQPDTEWNINNIEVYQNDVKDFEEQIVIEVGNNSDSQTISIPRSELRAFLELVSALL